MGSFIGFSLFVLLVLFTILIIYQIYLQKKVDFLFNKLFMDYSICEQLFENYFEREQRTGTQSARLFVQKGILEFFTTNEQLYLLKYYDCVETLVFSVIFKYQKFKNNQNIICV